MGNALICKMAVVVLKIGRSVYETNYIIYNTGI